MADKLNTAAANKLLKLLEEPTGTVFILISENEDIIQTIRFDVKYSFQWITRSNIAETLVSKKY
jgi:DNA polymerase-3 subunit delta'